MDNRPIGVFDSGLGGLTAVKELNRILPGEKILYFGDTGRVPYGTRSRETLIRYAREDVAFLSSMGVKRILIACGTASTVLSEIDPDPGIPVSGVLYAASRKAAAVTKNRRIGLIATASSIRSGLYEKIIASLDPRAEVISRATPLLVPLIEAGRIEKGDVVCETVVREYLAPIKEAGVDTLIMGCTHYPIIRGLIQEEMGDGVTLIDAGAAAVEELKEELTRTGALSDGTRGGTSFYVTDFPEGFAAVGSMFLGREIAGEIRKIDLT
ncbi:MAG: glutamate racemase [Clostridia bacterium]|nr:glutamate racemase [Clostridia bacterium]